MTGRQETDSDDESSSDEEHREVHLVVMRPGEAMIDTGCRTAVAGDQWHEDMRQELRNRGLEEEIRIGENASISIRRRSRKGIG